MIEQVVTQLQQEVITLKAQVAVQTGFACAVRAINNLATGQVPKDTPSPIDVTGLGRPMEFTGQEEDCQQWSKKTEAFFAGVIKVSEMMVEWSAEYVTEITTELSDLQQMQTAHMALTSHEADDIVANLRKNPLEAWRRLHKRYDPTTGGSNGNLLLTIVSLRRCFLLELQAGIERFESL